MSSRQALVQTQRPEKASALSVITAHLRALKVIGQVGRTVSVHKFFALHLAIAIAPCNCFATCNCCHDREKCSNLSPFTGFTQLAHPSPMFTINADNCLFLCSCLWVCRPVTRSIMGSSPSSCSGVWDPWSVEYHPANLQCCCNTEAETGFVPTSARFLRCKHLLDTEVSILNSFLYPIIIVYHFASFGVLLPTDPSKNLL